MENQQENNQPKSVFETLNAIDCSEHTEKKKNGQTELTYLSWPWAWAEVKKRYPDASYTIYKDEQKRPFIEDPDYGLMCYTTVTINGQTHEMWLPVMDGANRAMKRVAYNYETKKGESKVEAATMFDINKTIMRCLVKNLAMFGLGLYIYAGEDLPEGAVEAQKQAAEEEIDKLVEQIQKAEFLEDAQKIWKEHPKYQSVAKFLDAAKAATSKPKRPVEQPQQQQQ